ncbi:MAG: hypothetical protein LBL61_07485 [Elusimicrobiota bacterium]|nr:hypothetical protein [Elusimicrobiota bacterium]
MRIIAADNDINVLSVYKNGIEVSLVKGKLSDFKFYATPVDNYLMVSIAAKTKSSFTFEPATDIWVYSKPAGAKPPYKSLRQVSDEDLLKKFSHTKILSFQSFDSWAVVYYEDFTKAQEMLSYILKKHSVSPGNDLIGNMFFALDDLERFSHNWSKKDILLRLILGEEEFKIKLSPEAIPEQKYPEYINK